MPACSKHRMLRLNMGFREYFAPLEICLGGSFESVFR